MTRNKQNNRSGDGDGDGECEGAAPLVCRENDGTSVRDVLPRMSVSQACLPVDRTSQQACQHLDQHRGTDGTLKSVGSNMC